MQRLSKKYSNVNFIKLFILIALFTVSHISHAASINLSPNSGSYKVGDTIKVSVLINTNGVPVNATEDSIKFSTDTLKLVSISKGGSIITNWIVDPAFSNSAGTASLIGGILGGNGYSGGAGLVATLTFKATAIGVANVSFISASILANDGNGTELISGKGTATFNISASVVPKVQVTEDKTTGANNDSTIKIQQIKENMASNVPPKFLILSPRQAKDDTYTVKIDSLDIISWVDDGTHIFQTPPVSKGDHNISVQAFDKYGNSMNGFIKFYNNVVITPIITTYPTELHLGDIIVLKGLAEPDSDVVLNILNTETDQLTVAHTHTNSNGKFSYVSDSKVTLGGYTVTAKTVIEDGAQSVESAPVTFQVVLNSWGKFVNLFSSNIIVLWLLLICLLISMYFVYRTHKSHKKLRQKIEETKDTITKSFGILADDVASGTHASMSEIKKDLKDAEKLLIKEVKDLDKEI